MNSSPAESQPFRVMLFEDNPDDENLAVRALQSTGLPLEIEVARDGIQALELIGLRGTPADEPLRPPNLVISDLKMPRMGGAEVLQLVRGDSRLGSVPFVVFTSSDEASDVKLCERLGATAYCVKPIDFGEYRECVKGIVDRWLLNRSGAEEPDCAVELGTGT